MIHHSANITMLKPPPASFVQDGQHQQHQIASNMAGNRRSASSPGSHNCHNQPTTHHQHHASMNHHDQDSSHHHAAAQYQTYTPSQSQPQHQQYQAFAQEANKRHSMDLITPRATSFGYTNTNNNGHSSFPSLQNNLFQSSSHHTAHTAVAGDLLSMSRRALDYPPLPTTTKKRSATMVDGMLCGSDVGDNSTSTPGRYNNNNQHAMPQPTTPTPHNPQLNNGHHNVQNGSFIPNLQDTSCFNYTQMQSTPTTTTTSTSVSSPLVGVMGGNTDESYQNHRTIRRCLRSDSFEMMDDC
jgi:hypothetical protein